MTCRQLINITTLGHFSRTSVYGRSIILTENKARYIKKRMVKADGRCDAVT